MRSADACAFCSSFSYYASLYEIDYIKIPEGGGMSGSSQNTKAIKQDTA